jgi:hypothetical protein
MGPIWLALILLIGICTLAALKIGARSKQVAVNLSRKNPSLPFSYKVNARSAEIFPRCNDKCPEQSYAGQFGGPLLGQ